jgi:hypothetical protein
MTALAVGESFLRELTAMLVIVASETLASRPHKNLHFERALAILAKEIDLVTAVAFGLRVDTFERECRVLFDSVRGRRKSLLGVAALARRVRRQKLTAVNVLVASRAFARRRDVNADLLRIFALGAKKGDLMATLAL